VDKCPFRMVPLDMDQATLTSDEDLIAAIRSGEDAGTLDTLVERHLPRVRSMVFQMICDDAAADDVTQEVFLRAIRALAGFDGRSKFSTWLFRIAKNTALTHLERRSRVPSSSSVDAADCVAVAAAPDRQLLSEELSEEIRLALAHLSPALRSAIVLTSLQGLSPSEAAKVEECSTATIYWRIHEARKQLRKRLKEHL
jgi:RNA polymerase sigma-70 factor, ECF subfamily